MIEDQMIEQSNEESSAPKSEDAEIDELDQTLEEELIDDNKKMQHELYHKLWQRHTNQFE